MNILGISALYHDSAAALVQDGNVVAAAQEERFTRRKHDDSWPRNAISCCLAIGQVSIDKIDFVVFYEKPHLKAQRLLATYLATAPGSLRPFARSFPGWLMNKSNVGRIVRRELGPRFKGRVLFTQHHESHAASAFFASPFSDAAILTVDGVGEWATTTLGVGEGNRLALNREIRFPHSLGLLYSAFTAHAGFRVNSGEYKLMGLAPYGEPRFVDRIYGRLIEVEKDGSFRLNQKYFDYRLGLRMTNERFDQLFEGPPREPETAVTQREMDLAASIQVVTEDIMLRLARNAYASTGQARLCLAGGVALNCVANGRILREGPFREIWVQPAAGDAGGALGAALFTWYQTLNRERIPAREDAMKGAFLGPEFSNAEIAEFLDRSGIPYEYLPEHALLDRVAGLIAGGCVVGWFQGRMEFGPRALGARSILGDARDPNMQTRMNMKIKHRESFRPFAPSVLREHAADYFDFAGESPYMLLVANVAKRHRTDLAGVDERLWGISKLNVPRSDISAVTHVDYSARLQTVDPERHGLYYRLIRRFFDLTGCPVVINTSFNIRGEPIVCIPEDAYRCFMFTQIDALALGNCLLMKERQPLATGAEAYRAQFQLD
jgi:carbamoyltransferase